MVEVGTGLMAFSQRLVPRHAICVKSPSVHWEACVKAVVMAMLYSAGFVWIDVHADPVWVVAAVVLVLEDGTAVDEVAAVVVVEEVVTTIAGGI